MQAKIFQQGCMPYLVYGLFSIFILGQLLLPREILTLDSSHVFSYDAISRLFGLDSGVMASAAGIPFDILVWALDHLLPVWFIQKMFLFLVLFLAGLGAHKLVRLEGIASYYTGILYMINPFTYTRFMAGQWGILWAYALTPFAIAAFIDLLDSRDRRAVIKLALLSTLVGMLQIHAFFLLTLVFGIIFISRIIRDRKNTSEIAGYSKRLVAVIGIFLAINLYWIVPLLTAEKTLLDQISKIEMTLFSPEASSSFGTMFDVASMYGFWRAEYVYVGDLIPMWSLFFVPILFLALYGFISHMQNTLSTLDHSPRFSYSPGLVVSFGFIGVISFVLAVGAASELTQPLFEWLWDHSPFFRGFRDSHKFVALLCLSYAFLGGLGLHAFVSSTRYQTERLRSIMRTGLIGLALLIPLAYSFTMFGFYGQLETVDYPEEWHEANCLLNDDEQDFNILFLPWHQYMNYGWVPNEDKRIASLSVQFFDKPVIAGDNMEFGGIYSQSANPTSKYVEFLLDNGNTIANIGELLAPLNVKYIILVHEVDYEEYDFLHKQQDISVDLSLPGMTLFRNQHPTSNAYAVDSTIYIANLDEYLELSQTQDVMEHMYIIGDGSSNIDGSEIEHLELTEKYPVKYEVEGSKQAYTVFTVSQNVNTDHWEYNGHKPVARNLGFMPVFESNEDGGEIVYTRFYWVYLPCYIVSGTTLLILVWLYFRGSKSRERLARFAQSLHFKECISRRRFSK